MVADDAAATEIDAARNPEPFWYRGRVEQTGFLVDGEAYYAAFADS